MSKITDRQQEIIDNFNLLEEWEDKYDYILDVGEKIPLISQDKEVDEYLVKGCQSKMWLDAEKVDGKIYFYANSEAEIPKGLAALLVDVLSGNTPDEIINAEIYFLKETEIIFHLSPNRVKGVNSLIDKMKEIAINLK